MERCRTLKMPLATGLLHSPSPTCLFPLLVSPIVSMWSRWDHVSPPLLQILPVMPRPLAWLQAEEMVPNLFVSSLHTQTFGSVYIHYWSSAFPPPSTLGWLIVTPAVMLLKVQGFNFFYFDSGDLRKHIRPMGYKYLALAITEELGPHRD